ncbi:phosphoribosylglycinamide formyltransferase [Sporosarcina gallistercoris]|uniref:Phosphoribosylglycinamide formyltransferase n=1 Tax=Sporosarcina gallistercoris TaxID=2762245 RepID=A0ABR8PJD4_9BACL|nr:phosphoribosylglycinamide formyltransferase [Sporosarcina gallistercoris]MBD7908277.1 phosphoribosylglycinamide formyltransferase [Sporosarcina gallistercoris]
MKKIAVFASGTGSNFQALVDAVKAGTLEAEIRLLVCDQPSASVLQRARKEEIDRLSISPKDFPDKGAFETEIVQQLKLREVEFIVLAGYMRLIGPTLLQEYPGAIVNIHPSLLPAFPGKDAIGQAIDAGVRVSGLTIHYVDAGMDTGPIIAQKEIRIHSDDTKDELQKRIQQQEHVIYPEVLQELFTKGKKSVSL